MSNSAAKMAGTLLLTAVLATRLHGAVSTNWVAYNDHQSGTGTSPNVTTFTGGTTAGTAVGGNLKNFSTGAAMPAGVTIMPSGSTLNGNSGTSLAPTVGSPADLLFSGKVEWTGSAYYIGASPYSGAVTLTFTNLDPSKRYVFRGTAVRGGDYPGRWLGVFLEGAQSSVPAHITGAGSPGIVTNGWAPYGDLLPAGTAAIYNTGDNRAGDVIGWDDIVPAANGTFSLVNTNAIGTTATPHYPNNQSRSTYGYVFSAWMLAEVGEATPVEFVTQPAPATVEEFRPFTLSVSARGTQPTFQWYKDGQPIDGATGSSYSVARAQLADAGDYYVVVTGELNTITSETVHVTVNDDLVAPTVISVVANTPTNIVIAFSEILDMTSEGMGVLILDPANWFVGSGARAVYPTNNNTGVVLELYDPLAEDSDVSFTYDTAYDLAGNPLSISETVHTWKTSACAGLRFDVFGLPTGSANTVSNLVNQPNYPNAPRESYTLSAFDTRQVYGDDSHDYYGSRIRGLFIPPRTGNWRLYLRSDDSSELYFNTNGPTADGAVKVAQQTGCCNAFSADVPGGLASAFFPLVAGQAYYIEARQAEGTGGDYLQVAASLEGDPVPATPANNGICDSCIPAAWLGAIQAPATLVANLTIEQQPVDLMVQQDTPATFRVNVATDIGAPVCYQWRSNGVDIVGATSSSYTLAVAALDANGSTFSVQVTTLGGATVASREAVLTVFSDVAGPTLVSAKRLDSPTTILVTFSERVAPGVAGDNFSYTLCEAFNAGNCIDVLSAVLTNNDTQVLLETATPAPNAVYRLTALDTITDIYSNPIQAPLSTVVSTVATFQQGDANGYTGTVDTHVRQDNPTTAYGTLAANLADNLSPLCHALLRFDNIFGANAGQVPPDATISSAKLRLRTDNAGNDIRVHRVLVPWSAASIWNDVGSANDGVSTTAGDAVATAELTFATGAVGDFKDIDVTASVLFWATNGGPNYGWLLVDSGDDGYQFNSSEAVDPTQRPQLLVNYMPSMETNPVVVVTQPAPATTLNEGQGLSLSVTVTGTRPTYQWFKNDAEIAGATGPSYSVPAVLPADGGKYYVRIANLVGTVQSDDALVTVVSDTTAPTVLAAQGGRTTNTTILVTFSEALNPATAENVANYELLGPGGLTIQSAVLQGASVVLTLSGERTPGENYQLRVTGVADKAAAANLISPNPATVPVSTLVELIGAETHTWKYLQQNAWGEAPPCLEGTAWTAPAFDDSAWASGLGLFHGTRDNAQPATLDGVAVHTYLNVFTNDANALQQTNYYFRTTFSFPSGSTNGASLVLHSMVDDGAVFYLNGSRLADVRLAADPVSCTNFASAGGSQAWEPALTNAGRVLPLTGLVPGQNTLAVQVAQNNGTSSDITFGVLLEAELLSQSPPAPTLGYAYDGAAKTLTLSWNAAEYVLEGTADVTGAWTQISATSPATVSTATGYTFYRLRKP